MCCYLGSNIYISKPGNESSGEIAILDKMAFLTETYKIQEYHLPVYHVVCAMLEVEFFC